MQDVVNAMHFAETADEMIGNVYNIATGNARTLLEAIGILEKVSSKKLIVEHLEERVGDIKYSAADNSNLVGAGYRPTYSFEEGAKLYWESLK